MSPSYSSSPTLFYPMPAPQPFFPTDHILQSPASQWAPAPLKRPAPVTNPSRKRSRDAFDDEPATPPASPPAAMEVEPVYGEGMTLIDPHTGRALSAESQTGTWYEENLEMERLANAKAAADFEQDRLDAQGRPTKSLRLESPAPVSAALDNRTLTNSNGTPPPVIVDAATLRLGVGWKALDTDDTAMQSAARGWARFIENHFPVLGAVEIFCKSEGLEAFLVKATAPQEGWWLFKDDLSEGRLVGSSFEACVRGLTAVPMVFEGQDSLFAAITPSAVATPKSMVDDEGMEQATEVQGADKESPALDSVMFD